LWLVSLQPGGLRPDDLGAERGAAAGDDGVRAVAVGQLLDLGGGPHVDAEEKGGPDGLARVVARQHAGHLRIYDPGW
jgi:hypothetical protein